MNRQLRVLHTYLGVFFAPLLIFFAATGALQMIGGDLGLFPGKLQEPTAVQQTVAWTTKPHGLGYQEPLAYRVLCAVMGLGLMAAAGLGIVIGWQVRTRRVPIAIALAAGILLPLLLVCLKVG